MGNAHEMAYLRGLMPEIGGFSGSDHDNLLQIFGDQLYGFDVEDLRHMHKNILKFVEHAKKMTEPEHRERAEHELIDDFRSWLGRNYKAHDIETNLFLMAIDRVIDDILRSVERVQ